MHFNKLFSTILDSTLWQESPETTKVWITMLAMADRNGEVQASVPGLAHRAVVSLDECKKALECFMSPDPYSRTEDHEGRRIAEIEGGWVLLNHSKYRKLMSVEERREYNRKKQAEYRAKKKMSNNVNDVSLTVNDSEQCQHSTEAEVEVEVEAKRNTPLPPKGGWSPDPDQLQINSLFNRRESTQWSEKEIRAYRKLSIDSEDLELLSRYYLATDIPDDKNIRRRDIVTLLNNWPGEVDRARDYCQKIDDREKIVF